jgi:membrane-associated phospholipid phosphatase
MTDPHQTERRGLLAQAVILIAGAGAFAVIAHRVATKRAHKADVRVRERMQALRSPALDAAVKPVTVLSLPPVVVSATALLAWWLYREKRTAAALAVAVTPLIAATAGQSFTTFLAQRNPPDVDSTGEQAVSEPSFPSGHTTGVTAEAFAVGYILAREELLTPSVLAALIAWPLLVGVTRVYRDRHWASDIFGGVSAGTAVAAATTMLYEVRRLKTTRDF